MLYCAISSRRSSSGLILCKGARGARRTALETESENGRRATVKGERQPCRADLSARRPWGNSAVGQDPLQAASASSSPSSSLARAVRLPNPPSCSLILLQFPVPFAATCLLIIIYHSSLLLLLSSLAMLFFHPHLPSLFSLAASMLSFLSRSALLASLPSPHPSVPTTLGDTPNFAASLERVQWEGFCWRRAWKVESSSAVRWVLGEEEAAGEKREMGRRCSAVATAEGLRRVEAEREEEGTGCEGGSVEGGDRTTK